MTAEANRGDEASRERDRTVSGGTRVSAEANMVCRMQTKAEASGLMEAVVGRRNLQLAYQRVVENKGAAGVDDIAVSELKDHLKQHWPQVRAKLLTGVYVPQAVRRVDIPKPDGGLRTLGIPTVVDRLIQQALHQVLSPIFEPEFSEASYGFRPGRNAHQAVQAARQYVAAGKRWVVDMDLEKFFDRVDHELMMGKLAQKIDDARVLKLIRRYLEAGMMADGLVRPRGRARRKAGRSRPYCPTSYSPSWIVNWRGAAMPSAVTPTTAMCMCAVSGRARGCWRVSPGSCRFGSNSRSMARRARWPSRGGGSFWATALRGTDNRSCGSQRRA